MAQELSFPYAKSCFTSRPCREKLLCRKILLRLSSVEHLYLSIDLYSFYIPPKVEPSHPILKLALWRRSIVVGGGGVFLKQLIHLLQCLLVLVQTLKVIDCGGGLDWLLAQEGR